MSRNWTPSQLDAIGSRRGSVIVSAAAGSGKTAVLVERVISRITDENNPTSADRLLIVTFTNAAASEMRERISAAVDSLLRQQPDNLHLVRQQMLLPAAKICTIDSFCANLVKENFQHADLPPDYKTADEGELEIIAEESVNEALALMYEKGGEDFRRLSELLFSGNTDSYLASTVRRLYKASRSFPFPSAWLEGLEKSFDEKDISKTVYGEILIGYLTDCLEYAVGTADYLLSECEDEDIASIFEKAEKEDKAQYEYILEMLRGGKWDKARAGVLRFKAARRGNTPKHLKDDFYIQSLVAKRDACNKKVKELSKILVSDDEQFRDDMEFFRPLVASLSRTTQIFAEIYSRNKKEKKLADFDDIAHSAISLLVRKTEDGYEITDKARDISESFDEILIDEYQDTNEAQDMIFSSISRNNLFRVGDVKQSIYGFRQAMPRIFISLKESFPLYDREKDNYPAKIILGNNFRSRKGVTDIINFVFDALMSKSCGEIDYNEEERLVPSAAYPDESRLGAELHILDTGELKAETAHENQARYIAQLIKQMISEGFTVKDGEGERKASFGDFAVLLRSTKGKSNLYADVFRKSGVPAFTETGGDFLGSIEVSLALNLLRIIDNPAQDIPLMSVMMSALFGFTVDDMAQLRLDSKYTDLYACLLHSCEKGNEKSLGFLEKMKKWRQMSACLCVRELICEVFEDTGIMSIFDAVDPSGRKRSNLMLVSDYADTYEKMGYSGLSGFIRFVDRVSQSAADLKGSAAAVESADVVKIMSIHKSKGLEFPVCILAGTAGRFNKTDERENFLINLKHGVGIIRRDIDTFEQYGTLCHSAMKLSKSLDSMSEELRVLYVAMTRARERLISVYASKNPEKSLMKCADSINPAFSKISPFLVSSADSHGEWLVTALLRHPGARALRELIGVDESIVLPCASPLKVCLSSLEEERVPESRAADYERVAPDPELMRVLEEKISFRYKYEALSRVMTKRAASEVDRNFVDREYFASAVPSFLSKDGLTPAQKGIATHAFMQYADYERAAVSVEGEIERLREKGIITDSQAKGINVGAVREFFGGELAARILKSELVMREKKFTFEVPINEIYEGTDEFSDEMIMIQGIADCAFLEGGELVVVDYKTDALEKEEQFVEKYSSQVRLYTKALNVCTGYKVKETLLYSFRLGKAIKVDTE